MLTTQKMGMWMRTNVPPEKEGAFLSELAEEVSRYRRELFQGNTTSECVAITKNIISAATHRMVESQRQSGQPSQCKKGCHYCCSVYVAAYKEEAETILGFCESIDIPIDWERLRWIADNSEDTEEYLSSYPMSQRMCPFVGPEGECRIYHARPISCITYHVASDPERCNNDKYPGGEVGEIVILEVEVAKTALMCELADRASAEGKEVSTSMFQTSLAQQLLAVKGERDDRADQERV